MIKNRNVSAWGGCLLMLLGPAVAQAALTGEFSDLATFESAAGTTSTLDYDTLDADLSGIGDGGSVVFEPAGGGLDVFPDLDVLVIASQSAPATFDGFSFFITGNNNTADDANLFANPGANPIVPSQPGGDSLLSVPLFSFEHESWVFDLDLPASALGFEIGQRGPFTGTEFDIDFEFASGATASSIALTEPGFAGFTFDEPLTSFTLTSAGDQLFFLGDLRVVSIPEPSTWSALLAGGLVAMRRRRGSPA